MLVHVTYYQGGEFHPLETTISSEEAIIIDLDENIFINKNFCIGGPERSKIGNVAVHSVKFPSGRIWDATLKGLDTRWT